jgi:hypothetical protein
MSAAAESAADPFATQLAYVIGVEGWDDRWEVVDADTDERHAFAYTYDGVPDWVGRREFPDLHSFHVDYRTVVADCLFGSPPKVLRDAAGQVWRWVCSWTHSGERECMDHGTAVESGGCSWCEGDVGEPHGCVYVGDGWTELVYRSAQRVCAECEDPIGEEDSEGPCKCTSCATDDYDCEDVCCEDRVAWRDV